MISTVTLSFDLTYVDPLTGALAPRGIVTDTTDYAGLGIDLLLAEAKGLGVITFNGDIIVDENTVLTPLIDLQNWGSSPFASETPFYAFPLPLDANGNVANGVYTLQYSLRLNTAATPFNIVSIPTTNSIVVDGSTPWLVDFLEPGNDITLFVGAPTQANVDISSIELVSLNILINTTTIITSPAYQEIQFDVTNLQFSGVFAYSGCTQVNADVSFVYDCEYGDSGTWAVANTTPLASNEIIAGLNCVVSYPSWTAVDPLFNPQVVLTSLPYPTLPDSTPLATGTYTVSLTEQIQQTQTSGLIVLYSKTVIKEFSVSCAGSLCGLSPCIENLRAAHQAELTRNKISKYQVFVDNVLMYYAEAMTYKACGELDKYRAAIACIQAQLDASGCECACCDNETYYWVSNNSANSVIQTLLDNFQYRLYDGGGADPGDTQNGVQLGAIWQDVSTGILYRCIVDTPGFLIWEEYYAPGIVQAVDVTATATPPYLTAGDVQGQLVQAGTQFALQFLQNAQYDADINAIQANLAALDGINGLTRVGDDFRLGGTLDAATIIDVDGNSLTIVDATNPLILSVEQAFPGVGQNLVLQSSNTGGAGANGIGSSIEFQAETTAGAVNRTAVIRSRWTDAAAQDSDFQIAITEGGLLDIGFTVNADKSVTLNGYNSTTFEDPAPAYLLGVDASGNVVQAPANPIIYAGRTRFSGGAVIIAEYGNTTGATISISNTGVGVYTLTASSPVFNTSTVAFVQMQTAGFVDVVVTSTTVITIRTYNTAGVANDAVIAAGSYVKVEIY